MLPSSQGARSHGHILGPCDRAGEIVGQVHRGLDRLGELDHHHITQGVAVLVVGSVRIRTMCCKDTQTNTQKHTKARVIRVEQEVKAQGQKWKMLVSAATAAGGGLRGAKVSAGDHGRTGTPRCAGQVVLHVLLCLDVLAELHHHDVRDRVAILANKLESFCSFDLGNEGNGQSG